jgi:hypothetical protein
MAAAEMERKLLAVAMVDPRLTEDEVAQWQTNSPAGELQPVADTIARISGMEKNYAKGGSETVRT